MEEFNKDNVTRRVLKDAKINREAICLRCKKCGYEWFEYLEPLPSTNNILFKCPACSTKIIHSQIDTKK
jgi:predicted Zn-ribbon and HTH transcriptional regulator